jgi:hypothetical protein
MILGIRAHHLRAPQGGRPPAPPPAVPHQYAREVQGQDGGEAGRGGAAHPHHFFLTHIELVGRQLQLAALIFRGIRGQIYRYICALACSPALVRGSVRDGLSEGQQGPDQAEIRMSTEPCFRERDWAGATHCSHFPTSMRAMHSGLPLEMVGGQKGTCAGAGGKQAVPLPRMGIEQLPPLGTRYLASYGVLEQPLLKTGRPSKYSDVWHVPTRNRIPHPYLGCFVRARA